MYEALYRKYRPKTFDDVAGQEHITETLKMQVSTGRLGHAYLFIGTRGTGKTTCARILAKAVNCEHPVNGNPCCECASCRGIEEGTILDVTELDAASNNGVDDVRLLRDEAVFSPTTVRKRVYIIDEVHMLSKPAFNALLKILEEPPEHLMFILATTELNKVLPTILSRCQRHSFRRLDADVVANYLKRVAEAEGLELTEDAAVLLGRLADGGMRDGMSLLDQCSSKRRIDTETVLSAMGLAGAVRSSELARALASHDVAASLESFRELWRNGKDPASLLGELAGLYRDALLLRVAPKGGTALLSGAYEPSLFRELPYSAGELLAALDLVNKYQSSMRDASSPRLQAELCLIELCGVTATHLSAPSAETPVSIPAPVKKAPERPAEKRESDEELPPPDDADAPPWEAPPLPEAEESVPAKEEAPAVREEKAVESAAGGEKSAEAWAKILEEVGKAQPGAKMLLTMDVTVSSEIRGDELIISALPGFALNWLNQSANQELLRRCSGLRLRIEEKKPDQVAAADKLDALSRFGNVTIK